jgi:flagellar hook-basal body complex protein FliE
VLTSNQAIQQSSNPAIKQSSNLMRINPTGSELKSLVKVGEQMGNAGGDGDFAQKLMDVLKEVNHSQLEAREKQNAFMTGQPVEIHDLMIAMERASTAMQLTLQVRNKLLEAYQEINRMQV